MLHLYNIFDAYHIGATCISGPERCFDYKIRKNIFFTSIVNLFGAEIQRGNRHFFIATKN